jgi:hypothetical protein
MGDKYGWVKPTGDRDLDAMVRAQVAVNREADRTKRRLTRYERAVQAVERVGGSRWDVPYPLPSYWVPPKRYHPTLQQARNLYRPRDTNGRYMADMREHGSIARYQRGGGQDGCRCDDCCEAWRGYFRAKMRERRGGRTLEPEPEPLDAAERFVADWRAKQERLNTVTYTPAPW